MKILLATNYWGSAGAGICVKCSNTNNYLWVLRSRNVNEPYTWSLTVGGKIDDGENPYEAATRELSEEMKYKGSMNIDRNPINVFRDGNFTYTTFLAVVPVEFSMPPYDGLYNGNWETEDFKWSGLNDPPSSKIHFGTKNLLRHYHG